MKEGITENVVDIEGIKYVCMKNTDAEGNTTYSMNAGKDWCPTMIEAYQAADKAGNLVTIEDPAGEDQEEFQVFILHLIRQLKELCVGEKLSVHRGERLLTITKEVSLHQVRGSAIQDIDFEIKGD